MLTQKLDKKNIITEHIKAHILKEKIFSCYVFSFGSSVNPFSI